MKINLATKITIFRILLVPFIIILLLLFVSDSSNNLVTLGNIQFYSIHLIATFVFALAAITDAIDGYIARSKNMITNLGKFLDPVADKLLVNSLLIYLAYTQNLPVALTIIMISRDILVDALRLICIENNIVVAASIYGKLKTVFQMFLITLVLFFSIPYQPISPILEILAYVTTLVSVISGIDYFVKNGKSLKN